jgi:FtsP/CotA-like multicopper oxidase with cupredoxin domain
MLQLVVSLAAGPGFCVDSTPSGPSRDLYCLPLVAAPGIDGVSAVVELAQAPTPFGVAVTADGAQIHDLVLEARGLPDPASLGPYATYVAWAMPPGLDPVVKLGEVRDGRVRLGPVSFDKFLVIVSAERSAAVRERGGRIVLRGLSPSTRLDAHGPLALPATTAGERRSVGGHEGHGAHGRAPALPRGWPMPPMIPGITMIQSLAGLAPAATPWLPTPGAAAPTARAAEVLRPADGDTIRLEAAPAHLRGGAGAGYLFNGQSPGPVLDVAQGSTVHVEFVNRTEWPAAVHWHGLRLDARDDGVPGLTQAAVPPGGSFLYRLRFPDAGVYWYHPHHREDVLQDLGLYGTIVVRPPAARDADANPVHRELPLVLDDRLVGDGGPFPYGRESPTHALMGRLGTRLLVNGAERPRLAGRPGEVLRLLFVNAASARVFNVAVAGPDGDLPLKLVAADAGPFARERWVESVVLAPSERYVVEVRLPAHGEAALVNRVRAIDHAAGAFIPRADTLATVAVAGAPAPALAAPFDRLRERPAALRELGALARAHRDRAPDRELLLTLAVDSLPFRLVQLLRLDTAYAHPVEWAPTMPMMDWLSTGRETEWRLRDAATGLENHAIRWRFPRGSLVKLRLRNDRHTLHPMAHPIHLHGQRFLVLARNGAPVEDLAWKDTALVPAGGTVELLLDLANPGDWMLHCHNAEHLSAGMHMALAVD